MTLPCPASLALGSLECARVWQNLLTTSLVTPHWLKIDFGEIGDGFCKRFQRCRWRRWQVLDNLIRIEPSWLCFHKLVSKLQHASGNGDIVKYPKLPCTRCETAKDSLLLLLLLPPCSELLLLKYIRLLLESIWISSKQWRWKSWLWCPAKREWKCVFINSRIYRLWNRNGKGLFWQSDR